MSSSKNNSNAQDLPKATEKWLKCQKSCTNDAYNKEKEEWSKKSWQLILKEKSDASIVKQSAKATKIVSYNKCAFPKCRSELISLVGSFIPAFKRDIKDSEKFLKKMDNTNDPNYKFWYDMKENRIKIVKSIEGYKTWDDEKLKEVLVRLSSRQPYQLFY